MFRKLNRIPPKAMPMLLGLGIAAIAIGAGQAGSDDGGLSCKIEAESSGNMVALQGVVQAGADAKGEYRFSVKSVSGAGNTDINQGGTFTADGSGSARLGQVTLGSAGAIYDASLEVTSNGETAHCEERIGGRI